MYHPVANNDIVDLILHPVHMSMSLQIHGHVFSGYIAIAMYVYMHTCMQLLCMAAVTHAPCSELTLLYAVHHAPIMFWCICTYIYHSVCNVINVNEMKQNSIYKPMTGQSNYIHLLDFNS